MERLLTAISAGSETAEIQKLKLELLRTRFDEQRRSEMRKTPTAAIEGTPTANLKPWREIVTPHPDVASGKYQQAEFAADLWQVYNVWHKKMRGNGSHCYNSPVVINKYRGIVTGKNS